MKKTKTNPWQIAPIIFRPLQREVYSLSKKISKEDYLKCVKMARMSKYQMRMVFQLGVKTSEWYFIKLKKLRALFLWHLEIQ